MTRIDLRRTWHEISEKWYGDPNPLRVAETINRVNPRSWVFKFTFDGSGHLILKIDSDPPLTDQEALGLLDGTVEEAFFANTVFLRQGDQYVKANTRRLVLDDSKPDNALLLKETLLTERASLILEGYWFSDSTPPRLQNEQEVRSYFLENTWLGSLESSAWAYTVTWVMFGATQRITPSSRYASALSGPMHVDRVELVDDASMHLGAAVFQTSESLVRNTVHDEFGPLDASLPRLSSSDLRSHSWMVEVQVPSLRAATLQGLPRAGLVLEIGDALGAAFFTVIEAPAFAEYNETLRHRIEAEGAARLRKRQERARTARRVFLNREPVMLEPSNENEVLALLCKLEMADALPFVFFRLWEYTARIGIDAIASYQVLETDVPAQYATVEVEFHYENFFDHGHAPRHVNLVICWDFRDGEPPKDTRRRSDLGVGFYEYKEGGWTYVILTLSSISALTVMEV